MDTSLSISGERLSLVVGSASSQRASIKRFASVALPEGALINGSVTDEKAFEAAVEELRETAGANAFKRVRLAIGTNQMFVKRAVAPKMPEKRLLEWVGGEFGELADPEEPLVFDYEILKDLGRDQGNEALLAAARTKLIHAYEERFSSMKIHIDSMTSTQCAIKNLVSLLPETREKTGVVLLLEGNVLDATLFVKGGFRYNSRTRLFAERGGNAGFDEISRTISSLIQFNLSERSGESVTDVFFAGVTAGEEALYPRLETAFGVKAATIAGDEAVLRAPDGSFRLSDYAVAVGNLMKG